jgi:hypothetical protein
MARDRNRTSVDKDAIMYDCFLCERPFQFGPHIYNGEMIPTWGVIVCQSCLRANEDGIVLEDHSRLKALLRDRGIIAELNAKGWLPLPPHGPVARV